MKASAAMLELLPPILPLRSVRRCPRCSFRLSQRRGISFTTPLRAALGQMQMPRNAASLLPREAMQSQQSMMKNAGKSRIPTDIGLLPMTFVPPSLKEVFRMYRDDKRKLLRVLWLKFTRNMKSLLTLIYFLKWTKRRNRLTGKAEKKPSLQLTRRLEIARINHFALYLAMAKQDMGIIQKIACAGLLAKVKSRIDFRKSERLPPERWALKRYNGLVLPRWIPWPISYLFPFRAIKAVSENIAPLPFGGKDALMRQTIVKIKSRQVFDKGDGKGEKTVDLTEYVVIQRVLGEGVERQWMIWGTVQPSTKEEIDRIFEIQALEAGGGFWERVKNLIPMGGGGGGAML